MPNDQERAEGFQRLVCPNSRHTTARYGERLADRFAANDTADSDDGIEALENRVA